MDALRQENQQLKSQHEALLQIIMEQEMCIAELRTFAEAD